MLSIAETLLLLRFFGIVNTENAFRSQRAMVVVSMSFHIISKVGRKSAVTATEHLFLINRTSKGVGGKGTFGKRFRQRRSGAILTNELLQG